MSAYDLSNRPKLDTKHYREENKKLRKQIQDLKDDIKCREEKYQQLLLRAAALNKEKIELKEHAYAFAKQLAYIISTSISGRLPDLYEAVTVFRNYDNYIKENHDNSNEPNPIP